MFLPLMTLTLRQESDSYFEIGFCFTENPPAFACHKTESHTTEGRITYNGCNVPTEGMNPNTGIFTVKVI